MNRFPLYLRLYAALSPSRPLALCYACEKPTAWSDDGMHYRCTRCGGDPVEHAPED